MNIPEVTGPEAGEHPVARMMSGVPPLTGSRAVLWSVLLAGLVFSGSLGNGFAYDDEPIIPQNGVVTEAQWGEAALGPYWQVGSIGTLYRPVTLLGFTAQWQLFGGSPGGFHLTSVLLHMLVTGLVAWLALRLARRRSEGGLPAHAPLVAAVAGGVFALHPVHVEAVANVVGQSELWAALGVLGAVHLYLWNPGPAGRALRILGIGAFYALGLGAKEIAVTLPLLLLLVDSIGRGPVALTARVRREIMVFAMLGVVLTAYLALRWLALGSLLGEEASPVFLGVGASARVATSLAVVLTLVRLLTFPFDLSADYDPAVLTLMTPGDPMVWVGAMLLLTLLLGSLYARRSAPLLSWGVLWALIAWVPVSNLLFATGVMMAERTLYLSSVGVAIAAGVIGVRILERAGARALVLSVAVVAAAFAFRTVTRVPTWFSTFTVHETLATEHPESWRSDRARAAGLMRIGEEAEAFEYFESALAKMPNRFDLLLEYGVILKERRRLGQARELLERAVAISPARPETWRLLAELHLIAGRPRDAHRVAATGRIRAGEDAELWRLISESYVAGGFLPAAVRARRVSEVLEPGDPANQARLRQLLDVLGTSPDTLETPNR